MFTLSPQSNSTGPSARFDGSRRVVAGIAFSIAPCARGFMMVATSERSIRSIMIGDDPEMLLSHLQNQFPNESIQPGESNRECLSKILDAIESPEGASGLALDNRGMGFQTRVWDMLQKVPAGTLANYTFLAEHICSPDSMRGGENL